MHCWNCKSAPGAGPLCQSCRKIQPLPSGADHFAVLGLDRRFAIDSPALEQRYRDRQRKLHPDRFALASPEERRMSLLWATAVNDAHRTLRDPMRRATYVLSLAGIAVGEENGAGERHAPMDPAFLAKVLEMREALAEAQMDGDAAKVGEMTAEARHRHDEIARGMREHFDRWEASGDAAALEPIAPLLAQIRYYERFLDEAAADAREGEAP